MKTILAKSQKGFGLIEVIVGVALIGVFVYIISSMVVSQKQQSAKLQGSPQCISELKSVIDKFQSQDNFSSMSAWHPSFAVTSVPAPIPPNVSAGYGLNSLFPIVENTSTRTLVPANSTVGANYIVNSWILSDNGINWATKIYNDNGTNFCANDVNTWLAGIKSGSGTGQVASSDPNYGFLYPQTLGNNPSLKNPSLFLNVRKLQSSTAGTTAQACRTDVNPVPVIPISNAKSGNNPDIMEVTAVISYLDPAKDNQLQTCQGTVNLSSRVDRVPADFQLPTTLTYDPTTTVGVVNNLFQVARVGNTIPAPATPPIPNTGIVCGNQSFLEIGVAAREPGVIFLCHLDYNSTPVAPVEPATPDVYQPCYGFRDTSAQYVGKITATTGPQSRNTEIKIRLTPPGANFPDGQYLFSFKSVDIAGNEKVQLLDLRLSSSPPAGPYTINGPFSRSVPVPAGQQPLLQTFSNSNNSRGHWLSSPTYSNITFNYSDPHTSPFGDSLPGQDDPDTQNIDNIFFQCQNGNPATDKWQIVDSSGSVIPIVGANWYVDNVVTPAQTGSLTFDHPAGADATGDHFIGIRPVDACGNSAGGNFGTSANDRKFRFRTDNLSMATITPTHDAFTGQSVLLSSPADVTSIPSDTPLDFQPFGGPALQFQMTPVTKTPLTPLANSVKYACQIQDDSFASPTISMATLDNMINPTKALCAPTFSVAKGCTQQNSKGFRSVAFDGCGRNSNLNTTRLPIGYQGNGNQYQVLAKLGESCADVPCMKGLICATDDPSNGASQHRCVAKVNCTGAGTCGSGYICYQNSASDPSCGTGGTCQGTNIGPITGGQVDVCPSFTKTSTSAAPPIADGYSPNSATACSNALTIIGWKGGCDSATCDAILSDRNSSPMSVCYSNASTSTNYTVYIRNQADTATICQSALFTPPSTGTNSLPIPTCNGLLTGGFGPGDYTEPYKIKICTGATMASCNTIDVTVDSILPDFNVVKDTALNGGIYAPPADTVRDDKLEKGYVPRVTISPNDAPYDTANGTNYVSFELWIYNQATPIASGTPQLGAKCGSNMPPAPTAPYPFGDVAAINCAFIGSPPDVGVRYKYTVRAIDLRNSCSIYAQNANPTSPQNYYMPADDCMIGTYGTPWVVDGPDADNDKVDKTDINNNGGDAGDPNFVATNILDDGNLGVTRHNILNKNTGLDTNSGTLAQRMANYRLAVVDTLPDTLCMTEKSKNLLENWIADTDCYLVGMNSSSDKSLNFTRAFNNYPVFTSKQLNVNDLCIKNYSPVNTLRITEDHLKMKLNQLRRNPPTGLGLGNCKNLPRACPPPP